ncbi:helix-turn-helix transcriptional regulator [Desulfobulbus alkaliphilus]|uniref:helix-turn-helix transcriptional regulator n=1 Tax=Desulfobulbus alkaliphilus TaxID=869814 RepID=UPI0019624885|nr:WYL domain-containing protein [Desulfobulbus alkaliphilus]MBM9537899.1 WYL domain-containing protein [Desulfobulbus alkaliphilus]
MAKYKPQHARLLFIDRKIREKKFPNRTTLAREWEVSAKTIGRDLEYMRYQLDAPLAYASRERGYYYTEEQYRLPAMDIRESDLFAIYLADKLLAQYENTPIHASLTSVFSKIEASLPDKLATGPGSDQARFTVFPPFATVILPEVLATVFACLRHSIRMEIDYKNPGGTPVRRRVDPYHGVRFEGDWYVVGYCHLRQAVRTFSLARIRAVRQLDERFAIPADFDFSKLCGSHFGVYWGKEEIVVRILFASGVADYIRERRWHPSQIMEERADGSLILTLTVNHLLELMRWILSWGDGAQVLEPEELAEDIRGTARRMVWVGAPDSGI